METTEHIVESYVRFVENWFTNSNIKAKGGKEIDILAIDKNGQRYHIESGITHKKHWALKSKPDKNDFFKVVKKKKEIDEWRHKNSVEYFRKEKFEHPAVIDRLKDFGFQDGNYKRIIVCWQVANYSVHEYAKRFEIEIWELKKLLKKLIQKIGDTYYSDEILRTLQLVKKLNNGKI